MSRKPPPRERRLMKIGRYELLTIREGDDFLMDSYLVFRVHPPQLAWPDNADSLF